MDYRKPVLALAAGAAAFAAGALAWSQAAPERGVAHPDLWPAAHSPGLVDDKTEAFVSDLISKMSVEEKVGQIIQADIGAIKPEDLRKYPLGSILAGGSSPPLGADDRAPAKAWLDTARAFRAVSLEARPGHVPIPVMFGIDAVHGNNNIVGATLFPHNIGLGAMRDPALMRRIGQATGEETAAVGIDWAFGPTLATPQNDRWGRTYEGYSENPAVVRSYAGPMVSGLQGQAGAGGVIQKGHVAASVKHFLGDGGTTDGRDQGDNAASEAELIRTHAQGYPAAIDAGTLTVMASFSSWQGVKMHGNATLLTGVLKGRMGFDGFVVGDWNGHGQVPGCSNESCPAAINAGLDMFMAPDSWKGLFDNTVAQVRSGQIPMSRLDDAVRRILRVKVKLGLFDTARPWEGRFEAIGSAEHRAIARQAVRESLVLLKNNAHTLPIRGSARVLVAGSGADDIGRQSGGWTLSWQGTGNTNADFPGATSIYAGIAEAVKRQGGSAELSAEGKFKRKPDIAVVVFGESPYAEGNGDLRSLEYSPADKSDLALLKRLKAQHIPVVAIFLSGRPLWVNPEINASDAFVAAWLPGSEGEGVADVLIGDKAGKPRHDFTGKLSYSWPKTAAQASLNVGHPPYAPLFAYGYGLSYAKPATTPRLSEVSGVAAADAGANTDTYFARGKAPAPYSLAVTPPAAIAAKAVDGDVQEGARQFTWSGEGTIVISGPPLDLTREANADIDLLIEYRLDARPSGPVRIALGSAALDLTPVFAAAPIGEWRSVKIKLSCFGKAGADLAKVNQPFALGGSPGLTLSLRAAKLTADPAGAVCLAKAP